MGLRENWVFCLGLILITASAILGAVTYCSSEQVSPGPGEVIIIGRPETGAGTFRIITAEEEPWEGELKEGIAGRLFVVDSETVYPLRRYHFLIYVFLALGLVMMLGSRYMKSVKISVKIAKAEG